MFISRYFRLSVSRRAFTLIELLIVVAIIAILAAIAVPNFLEAQVRAKVSRAHSDMQAIATGLESYAVDYNRYPPSYTMSGPTTYGVNQGGEGWYYGWLTRLVPITTPVAYLTAIPTDPFAVGSVLYREAPSDWERQIHSSYGYVEDYWGYFSESEFPKGLEDVSGNDVRWQLGAVGPDYELNYMQPQGGLDWGYHHSLPYDSTNGTRSNGDILRFGGSGGSGHGHPTGFRPE